MKLFFVSVLLALASVAAPLNARPLTTRTARQFVPVDDHGRCPDTGDQVDDRCGFRRAVALWRTEGSAVHRADLALGECHRYTQIALNFCLGKLTDMLTSSMHREIASLNSKLAEADRTEKADCGKGLGPGPCATAGEHVKALAAYQKAWKTYADQKCSYENQFYVSGSGYGSFTADCWIKLAAAQIDDLEKPID